MSLHEDIEALTEDKSRQVFVTERRNGFTVTNFGDPLVSVSELRAILARLPATVLAPPSVTAEQVALITDPRYPDGRAFGPVFTDSVHEAFRRGVDTALAAMGITITTGGE